MSSLVIVALPSKDDYIYKISSEKVPHLTILYLGDDVTKVKNLNKILDFVEHATNFTLERFGWEVDRRETFGDDLADVVFFSKSKYGAYKELRNFRSNLLKDDNIRTAYDSTTQFPTWEPHLTLGYPDTPAKPDDRDYPGINYVQFDRIAVWFADYEGIEFPLKAHDWDMAIAMSNLSHISEKPWSDYEESDYTLEEWHAACLIHLHEGPPTSKSKCKLPVKTPGGALNRNGVHAAAAALAGARSPLKASVEQKTKAASALRGYYKQLDETPPDSLKQSAIVDNILSHYGKLGMKWGVRNRSSSVSVVDKRKKIKTSGGKGLPAHPDALRAHRIGQIVKKSGTKALSNQELQDYTKRLQLEVTLKNLNVQQKNSGQKVAKYVLKQSGNKIVQELTGSGMKLVKDHLAKTFK